MASSASDVRPTRSTKIVISGGFGAGKTTFVGSVSEIVPLRTEAVMTAASASTDDLSATPHKTTTTVAMDFGRISIDEQLVLYLFGSPGQNRFWFMWDDLVRGAIGAVVLVDTRRLEDCFGPIDFFEARSLPFIVAINAFDGQVPHSPGAVREALQLSSEVPVVVTDARDKEAAKQALIAVVEHALRTWSQMTTPGAGATDSTDIGTGTGAGAGAAEEPAAHANGGSPADANGTVDLTAASSGTEASVSGDRGDRGD